MAKSFPWSTIVPAGSEQAVTADDHLRRLRLEIGERMGDVVEDWTADPVVLKQSVISTKAGKKRLVHSATFVIEPSEDDTVEYSDTGLTISQAANPIRAGIEFAAGCIIKGIRWIVTNGDTAPLTMKIASVAFDLGLATTTINTMQTVASGQQIVDSAASSPFVYTVVDGQMLFLSIDKGSGAQFTLHGVEITYDTPDGRSTL